MNEQVEPYEDMGEDGISISSVRGISRVGQEPAEASAIKAENYNRAWSEAFRLLQEAGMPTNHVPNRAERRAMAKQLKTTAYKPGKK